MPAPVELPFAAVDGDVDTQWVSGASDGSPAWWQIDFEHDRSVSAVSVTLGDAGTGRGRVRLVNDSGTSRVAELEPGDRKTVQLGGEATSSLRVEDATDGRGRLALAEVAIDGVNVRRPLVLPAVPPAWGSPDNILLRTLRDYRTGCVVIDQRTPCVEDRDVPSEEPNGFDRVVSMPVAASYDARLTARPRAGTALATLLQDRCNRSMPPAPRSRCRIPGRRAWPPSTVTREQPGRPAETTSNRSWP